MRTHILNRIVNAGYTPHTQDTETSAEVEILSRAAHSSPAHTQTIQRHTLQHEHEIEVGQHPQHQGRVETAKRKISSVAPSPTHTTHTHTHSTQGKRRKRPHCRPERGTANSSGTNRHTSTGQVSADATTHTHFIARDCLTATTSAYWEGDRNDQCEVCNTGGTLTECTRCNIVWHASCLHPTPPFLVRTQDAIVCGQACWLELTDALSQEGRPQPTKENSSTTSRQFLPRTHSTPNTTHPFPLVTYPAARTDKKRPPSPNEDAAGSRRLPRHHRYTQRTTSKQEKTTGIHPN